MEKTKSRLLREEYYFTRHASGLAIFVFPKQGLKKKTGILTTHYGSIDNAFRPSGRYDLVNVPAGIAHYLEHLLFKKPEGDISVEFGRWGAVHNALTSHTITQYFFSAHGHFSQNLRLLAKLVWLSYFPAENVERERPIIEQEFKMYQDMPELKLIQNLLNNLYHSHPVRLEIVGTLDSIKTISPELLTQCHRTFYHPTNMVMVVVGDLEPQSVVEELDELINNAFRNWKSAPNKTNIETTIERHLPVEPALPRKTYQCAEMPVARPQILMGYKESHIGLSEKALIKQSLITEMLLELLFSKATKLYQQLYTEGIINDSFSYSYTNHESYGFTLIGSETDQTEKLATRLNAGITQARKTGFKKRDLFRLKRKYLGHFIRLFDSPDAIASLLVSGYFYKVNPFDFPGYLKEISVQEIENRLFEHLDEKYLSVSIVKPLPQKGTTQ